MPTKAVVPYQAEIEAARSKFVEIIQKTDTGVVFEVESMFAMQAMQNNTYLSGIANNNLSSLRNAIVNVASIGLSLNPITQYAYLVPRDKAVCLDISYKGLIKLATDTGSILWAKADLVYERDEFSYLGPSRVPDHKANIFSEDRGKFVGCYCIAKTCDGDFLVEVMNAKEIEQIKSSSKTTKEDTPWRKWFGEMAKKSIIKRASKTWPKSDKNERLSNAISVLNEHEGIDFDVDEEGRELITVDQLLILNDEISARQVDIKKLLKYANVDALDQIDQKSYPTILAGVQSKPKREDKQ